MLDEMIGIYVHKIDEKQMEIEFIIYTWALEKLDMVRSRTIAKGVSPDHSEHEPPSPPLHPPRPKHTHRTIPNSATIHKLEVAINKTIHIEN